MNDSVVLAGDEENSDSRLVFAGDANLVVDEGNVEAQLASGARIELRTLEELLVSGETLGSSHEERGDEQDDASGNQSNVEFLVLEHSHITMSMRIAMGNNIISAIYALC